MPEKISFRTRFNNNAQLILSGREGDNKPSTLERVVIYALILMILCIAGGALVVKTIIEALFDGQ